MTGRVSYYLKAFSGEVDPVHPYPDSISPADCCTWLCQWKLANVFGRAWEIHCNEPVQRQPGDPPADQTQPRRILVAPGIGPITYVHFDMVGLQPCFFLFDQSCLTDGGGSDYWEHLSPGDTKLGVLDHLAIDYDCRLSDDEEAYPWTEPDYRNIINDVFRLLGSEVDQLGAGPNQGHGRSFWYDSSSLNRWWHDSGWPLESAPRVLKDDGEPWTVYVIPYGTDCRFPADLVLSRVAVECRLSGDPGAPMLGGGIPDGGVRIPASIDVRLWVKPRVRDGWQQIDCPVEVVEESTGDLVANLTYSVASDNCSEVPRQIHWRGLNGPRPWSKSFFEFVPPRGEAVPSGCCQFLWALDGTVIPGEVNDTSDPDGPQRFEGDVVLTLNTAPSELGCGG